MPSAYRMLWIIVVNFLTSTSGVVVSPNIYHIIMKKILSILCIILLSCVSLFASALADGDPGNGNPSSPGGLVTEGGGRNTGRGGPAHTVVIPLFFGLDCTVNLGLGLWFDGTPEFILSFSQPSQSTETVEFVNMTTGNSYYGVLAAGTTSCAVKVADAIGPWMVRIGTRVTYFTITSAFYNSNVLMH